MRDDELATRAVVEERFCSVFAMYFTFTATAQAKHKCESDQDLSVPYYGGIGPQATIRTVSDGKDWVVRSLVRVLGAPSRRAGATSHKAIMGINSNGALCFHCCMTSVVDDMHY